MTDRGAAGFDIERSDPAEVVRAALDGLQAGDPEVLADEASVRVRKALADDPRAVHGPALPAA